MTINIKAFLAIIFSFIVFKLLRSKLFYAVSFGAIVSKDLPGPNFPPINNTQLIALFGLLAIGILLITGIVLLFKKITKKNLTKTNVL